MEQRRLNGDGIRRPLTLRNNNRNPYTNRFMSPEERAREREKEIAYLNRIADLMITNYLTLTTHAKIKLWEDGENYQKIVKYVNNSQCHANMKLTVVNIHRVWRNKDPDRLETGNRMFLWHGTKRANIPQILDSGFRLPNLNRQMFGAGIYFADRISKSANYSDQDSTFLLLCEVGLGKVHSCKTCHNDWTRPPVGFDSVKATGKYVPDWTEEGRYCGAGIPFGKTAKCTKYTEHSVNFNEFIVYDTQKIIIRFLVEVQIQNGHFPVQLITPPSSCIIPKREVLSQRYSAPASTSISIARTSQAALARQQLQNIPPRKPVSTAPVYNPTSRFLPSTSANLAAKAALARQTQAQNLAAAQNRNTGGCTIL